MPLNPHQLSCPCWTKESLQHSVWYVQNDHFYNTNHFEWRPNCRCLHCFLHLADIKHFFSCIRLSPSTSIVILVSCLSCESLQLIESCYGSQDCLVLSLLLSLGGWLCLKLCIIILILSDDVVNSALQNIPLWDTVPSVSKPWSCFSTLDSYWWLINRFLLHSSHVNQVCWSRET